ncbi:glycerol kinase GlpK, partial [Gangjinia marincola]
IAWMLNHVDGARAKAEKGELCFGTIDTWLIYQLTKGKVFVTDVTNASRTMIFNIHSLQWDEELLELFSIPKSMLPTVKESSDVYGHVHKDILEGNIPIAGIAGDQQAALFGQLCTTKGMAKNTYGTGCFLLMNTGEKPVTSTNKLLTTVAWKINGKTTYALEGSVFVGGAAVQWLRDGLQLITDAKEVEEKANQVADNGGVYFVPALTGMGAPYWDPYAKGAIFGIDRGTTQGHIAAATLQGIAFQVHDIVRAMEQDAKAKCIELRVDGGAAANDYLMQFQADVFDFKVVRPKMLETTALGAAYLAGLAVGVWDDLSDLSSQWQRDSEFNPQMTQDKRKEHLDHWNAAVRQTRGWK